MRKGPTPSQPKDQEDQASKKSGGTVPIEKMRFMPGENQAENCQKLIDHLTNKVLGEKGMGSKTAHLLQEEEECEFDKPSLKVPDESKTARVKLSWLQQMMRWVL